MAFKGFSRPERNYSKLPHEWFDEMPQIKSLAELKVMLYILRHTWGFSEYGKPKRITLDEFQNGRRCRGGRMDAGTGMGKAAIIDGIKRAVEHGYLTVEEDGDDPGRIRKYYGLKMEPDDDDQGVRKSYPGCMDSIQGRYENDTGSVRKSYTVQRKKPGKKLGEKAESAADSANGEMNGFNHAAQNGNGTPLQSWEANAASRLHAALAAKRKFVGRTRPDVRRWAGEFRRLVDDPDGPAPAEIDSLLDWYCDHIDAPFVPKVQAASTFRERYVDLEDARRRIDADAARDKAKAGVKFRTGVVLPPGCVATCDLDDFDIVADHRANKVPLWFDPVKEPEMARAWGIG